MNVVIATTGTGGDLFPGIAVAERLKKIGSHRLLFVVSQRGGEGETVGRYGFPFETIRTGRLMGEGWTTRMKTLIGLPGIVRRARTILRKFGPDMVLGAGGHNSAPVVLAARMLGIRSVLMEQNAVPGLTNRLLAPFVDRIYTTFPGMEHFFAPKKVRCTGTPVRESFNAVPAKKEGDFSILVLGGSQGAKGLNDAVSAALPLLKDLRILHQTGRADFERVSARYRELGVRDEVTVVPFIEDMVGAYREADLVVSRAGASTLAELVAVGRPSILVPYPHAANDHQRFNALRMVESGGAEMILESALSGPLLAEKIKGYERDRGRLGKMAEATRHLPGRNAAQEIVEDMCQFV